MSEPAPITPVSPEENGLRETFLISLPAELREGLRQTTLSFHRLAARNGLLYGDPELDRNAAEMVGLWRELDFLTDLAGHYERRALGPTRQRMQAIRILLEETLGEARLLLPEDY